MTTETITNTTTAPTETTTTTTTSVPVDTQAQSQADTTVKSETSPNTSISNDAKITKAETQEAPVQETQTSEQAKPEAFKPQYNEMIQGYIDGDLTDEDYAVIEKTGLSKEQFNLMAEGYKALQEKNTEQLYSYAGGKESYNELKTFASTNLSDDEISAFNEAIATNNPRLTKIAVLGLKALYESEKGSKPSVRIESDGASAPAIEGYSSQKELIKAMNNRKYGRDLDYTNEVNARRAKSGF